MCFTIARPRPVPREARARSLRKKRSKRRGRSPSSSPAPSSAATSVVSCGVARDGERERRARAGVAKRVLDQVLDDDREHPRPKRELRVPVSGHLQLDVRPVGAVGVLGGHTLQLGQRLRRPERDDGATALELGQEEDVVDESCHLLDLGTNLCEDLCRIRPGLDQRQGARERRSQLVRDDRGESRAQLLVGFELARADVGLVVHHTFTRCSPRVHPSDSPHTPLLT